jgi:hypothetical protein
MIPRAGLSSKYSVTSMHKVSFLRQNFRSRPNSPDKPSCRPQYNRGEDRKDINRTVSSQYEAQESIGIITCLPMHGDQQRIVCWVYNSDEFSEFEHWEVLHTSKFSSKSDSVKTLCFQLSAWSYAHKHLIFHCKQHPAGRHACIDNSVQRAILLHVFNTTFLTKKEALITMV